MSALTILQADPDPFQFINEFLSSPVLRITGQVLILLVVVLWLALVYWTYTDAARRDTANWSLQSSNASFAAGSSYVRIAARWSRGTTSSVRSAPGNSRNPAYTVSGRWT
jgi:hypothetical protein